MVAVGPGLSEGVPLGPVVDGKMVAVGPGLSVGAPLGPAVDG